MNNYIVFFGRRGDRSIVWRAEENPVGVFAANDSEHACQQAAAWSGQMGAFFAVEGTFWGVRPDQAPKMFGQRDSVDEAITKLIERVEGKLTLDAGDIAQEATEADEPEGETPTNSE
jgi:hypothetical protein